MYTVERKYLTTINWVCTKNSNVKIRCPARCVTTAGSSGRNSIKLSHRKHNHASNSFKMHKPRAVLPALSKIKSSSS
ncbi:uncharacterized protein pre-mod(mdg4)-X [Drosophila virilis]|uniref:Uncharacterized protein, isoform A n=1 Tax=Drosophila virilis TaxID=7244 RepID=A0A0Q9WAL5_DROVI|nr:uncharacterized protein LOC26531033 [Drosophila virilis]XP_032295037.1 uncharacterized protein LOC26531033 [Drosophila virilis]KRF78292.1 uncharacterized protein Dvir_GJ26263, isoform A [Drosophila virilis]KRF78293.1 uncharacterized protein Dvir_GJ26263, isoform B [Drosophila virilis]